MWPAWLKNSDLIGCDLGRHHVRLAQVRRQPGGGAGLVLDARELPTMLADDGQYRAVVADSIREMISSGRFTGNRVASCLPPQDLTYRTMRLAPMPAAELPQAAHWKVASELGLKVDEFKSAVLDYATVREGEKPKVEALILGAKVDPLERHATLLVEAGLDPVAIDAPVCAVARCMSQPIAGAAPDAAATRVVLDLGHDYAFLLVVSGSGLVFARPVGAGLSQLDATLAGVLEISPEEAMAVQGALAKHAIDPAARWPLAQIPADRAEGATADAARMYGRELARQAVLLMHYYATTVGGQAPESGVVVTRRPLNAAALEVVGLQTGIDFVAFEQFHASASAEVLNPAMPARAGFWASAVGLAMYEQVGSEAKEAA